MSKKSSSPNDQGNAAAALCLRQRKTRRPPLALTDLLGGGFCELISMGVNPSQVCEPKPEHKPDYTRPIAREGEQQFACILRNRSGQSAGEIDMGVRDVTILCDAEQQDVVDTAYAIYESVCDQTKKTARRDV